MRLKIKGEKWDIDLKRCRKSEWKFHLLYNKPEIRNFFSLVNISPRDNRPAQVPPRKQDQDAVPISFLREFPRWVPRLKRARKEGVGGRIEKGKTKVSINCRSYDCIHDKWKESIGKLPAGMKFSRVAGLESNSRINYLNHVPETKKMKIILYTGPGRNRVRFLLFTEIPFHQVAMNTELANAQPHSHCSRVRCTFPRALAALRPPIGTQPGCACVSAQRPYLVRTSLYRWFLTMALAASGAVMPDPSLMPVFSFWRTSQPPCAQRHWTELQH